MQKLFDISFEGQALLSRFAVAFEKILDDKDICDYIDSINIEGHADIDGSYQSNYELSCKRAYAVINTMMAKIQLLNKSMANILQQLVFQNFDLLIQEPPKQQK